MKRGILFAALLALVGSTAVSCRRAADPKEIATVDSLITAMHAAQLTLNEFDTVPYATADSILGADRARFLERFKDTLSKAEATMLGEQFVQLREAHRRAMDHAQVLRAVDDARTRSTRLRADLMSGALKDEQVRQALLDESAAARIIESSVLQVIEHHRANQRALDRQPLVDSLLATTPNEPSK
ncbi:MAG TPA: hypothetical protein PLL57_04810 [Flavobacteriales bacterium]|nr:hypothetical protein [Flavobacteriales bacterium]